MSEYRRKSDSDDPLSPAHQALHDQIETVDQKLTRHVKAEPVIVRQAVAEGIEEHEAAIQHLSSELSELVPGLADVIYGPPRVHADTGAVMIDGNGHPIRDTQKGLRYQVSNGGLRTEGRVQFRLTGPQMVLVGTIVTALATIIVALIQQGGN